MFDLYKWYVKYWKILSLWNIFSLTIYYLWHKIKKCSLLSILIVAVPVSRVFDTNYLSIFGILVAHHWIDETVWIWVMPEEKTFVKLHSEIEDLIQLYLLRAGLNFVFLLCHNKNNNNKYKNPHLTSTRRKGPTCMPRVWRHCERSLESGQVKSGQVWSS